MIVIEMKLRSANGREYDKDLGTLVIDNITPRAKHLASNGRRRDYRARMYRRGTLVVAGNAEKMVRDYKPTRETRVCDHASLARPVQELVAKALNGMGYNADVQETAQTVEVTPNLAALAVMMEVSPAFP